MLILEEVQKAKARLHGQDPRAWIRHAEDRTPRQLAAPDVQAARQEFLRETLPTEAQAVEVFERILGGNELQDVNYLARGARAAHAVARVAIQESNGRLVGWGTGFLISPNVLITNNHVFDSPAAAVRSEAHFGFERDIDGRLLNPAVFGLDPDRLFFTSKALDFTVVAVKSQAENSGLALATYGVLPLVGTLGKVSEGEWLTIIQHPGGQRKQVCVRENRFLRRTDDVLWYSSDTVGGSSGSPVFNNDWFVVALHHSGVPEERNGRFQTVDGRDFDPRRDDETRIKWIANEGIRVSRIVETLGRELPAHPLLQPMFAVTPAGARVPDPPGSLAIHQLPSSSSVAVVTARPQEPSMSYAPDTSRTVTVTLRIDADGGVRVEGANAFEAAAYFEAAKKQKEAAFDVPFNAKYDDRQGYQEDFLGTGPLRVNLPALSPALEAVASKLLPPANPKNYVLKYHNYSVVMHSKRRFAIYSAANVRFDKRFEMSRPADVWREDPRIPLADQVTNFYYKGNLFDRGHLTRREDLEFGDTAEQALQSAADTCHWTNCTPQHERFNQNRELWQGIERHLLESAILQGRFHAQVITGPILEEDDPIFKKFPTIGYPARFWKVVATLDGKKKLFATAFILDQTDVIAKFGLEEAVPIGAYKTFQVPIAEVERLTGLTFTSGPGAGTSLSKVDPLRERRRTRETRLGVIRDEAALLNVPSDYVVLDSLESIAMPETP